MWCVFLTISVGPVQRFRTFYVSSKTAGVFAAKDSSVVRWVNTLDHRGRKIDSTYTVRGSRDPPWIERSIGILRRNAKIWQLTAYAELASLMRCIEHTKFICKYFENNLIQQLAEKNSSKQITSVDTYTYHYFAIRLRKCVFQQKPYTLIIKRRRHHLFNRKYIFIELYPFRFPFLRFVTIDWWLISMITTECQRRMGEKHMGDREVQSNCSAIRIYPIINNLSENRIIRYTFELV